MQSSIKLTTLARIICIDYGGKRCGLAVTDPLQIIATALTTVATKELYTYLAAYFAKEPVELILIGEPLNLDDTPTHATPLVKKAIVELGKKFPTSFLPIALILIARLKRQAGLYFTIRAKAAMLLHVC